MGKLRVLVTDGDYKHSIAIQRNLWAKLTDIELIVHCTQKSRYCRFYHSFDRLIDGIPLADVLGGGAFDMVIPVGADSVLMVADRCPEKAVLPAKPRLETCFNKDRTMALATELSVGVPRTIHVTKTSRPSVGEVGLPCVIKGARENGPKMVIYSNSASERDAAIGHCLARLGDNPNEGLLVQERVTGVGVGFFALYDRGTVKRIFMHQRLREWPPRGGASTAARAIRDPELERRGRKFLDALQWNGVAMVEFKHDPAKGRYWLMEVNAKFWGSTELAIAAGAAFPVDLVRLFRGENVAYSDAYNSDLRFYWPLDGDLVNLLGRWWIGSKAGYFKSGVRTNLGQSRIADLRKGMLRPYKLARYWSTGTWRRVSISILIFHTIASCRRSGCSTRWTRRASASLL